MLAGYRYVINSIPIKTLRRECFGCKGRAGIVSKKRKGGRMEKKEDEDAWENERLMEIESFVSCSLKR